MRQVKILDKEFELYISDFEINRIVENLSGKIFNDFENEPPVFLAILNGSFIFAADLIRKLPVALQSEITFIKLSSYSGLESAGNIQEIIGLDIDLKGKRIVIIEDIIETGTTLGYTLEIIEKQNPKEVKICTLFFKPDKFIQNYEIEYIGTSIKNDFIVGYGLDYNEKGRNLKDVYKLITE